MLTNVKHEQGHGPYSITDDRRISLKARGLWFTIWNLCTMINEDRRFVVQDFIGNYAADGHAATVNAFRELKYYGYIKEEGAAYQRRFYTLYDRTEAK